MADMRHEARAVEREPLESIFLGGGTPSLMPPTLVARLLNEACRLWGFAPDIEITLEANPSSVEAGRFADLAIAGVNRVSLGVQSLRRDALQFLGRLHDEDEAKAALQTAQDHFDRVSFDLIYGRPGQSLDAWHAELQEALSVGTGHLSLYQLTIEPGTRFATDVRRGTLRPLDDDDAAALFHWTRAYMADTGMPAYEISNFGAPGEQSRHNLTYWHYRDYLGIGAGAHGRRGGIATQRHKKPENFLTAVIRRGHGIAEDEVLRPLDQAFEAILMGLRLSEGVCIAGLAARFNLDQDRIVDWRKARFMEGIDLLSINDYRIAISEKGFGVLDAIIRDLVPDLLVPA